MRRLAILAGFFLGQVLSQEFTPLETSRLSANSFLEQFNYDDLESSGWIRSSGTKFDEGRKEEVHYTGQWGLEEAIKYPVFAGEKGLVLKSKAAHHAISKTLPVPFTSSDSDLVLQYEITLQSGFECGGAYIKLLNLQSSPYTDFNSRTPFQVMFGPDVCGANNIIHFIISRDSPITRKTEEKHMTNPPIARINDLTALYTLIIKSDQTYEIRINGNVAKAGSLLDEDTFKPPLNPPRKITDEDDLKPWLWDDRKYILDPENLEKPDDYDEKYLSHEVPDPNAVKPNDWLDSEPLYIKNPDPNSNEPYVLNPKCSEVSGCGPWSPPLVYNDNYKGPWIPPQIENPDYEGEWIPRLIDNPEYYEDTNPANLKDIGGLGFELWSMNDNILFNNIYLGHSIEEAEYIGNSTWSIKNSLQDKAKRLHRDLNSETYKQPDNLDELFGRDELTWWPRIKSLVHELIMFQYNDFAQFWSDLTLDPFQTIEYQTYKFIVYNLLFVTVISIIIGVFSLVVCYFSNPDEFYEGPHESVNEDNGGRENNNYEKDADDEIITRSKYPGEDHDETIISDFVNKEGVRTDSNQKVTKRKV